MITRQREGSRTDACPTRTKGSWPHCLLSTGEEAGWAGQWWSRGLQLTGWSRLGRPQRGGGKPHVQPPLLQAEAGCQRPGETRSCKQRQGAECVLTSALHPSPLQLLMRLPALRKPAGNTGSIWILPEVKCPVVDIAVLSPNCAYRSHCGWWLRVHRCPGPLLSDPLCFVALSQRVSHECLVLQFPL